jgi:polyisoprenoid-binding protein YceI
MSSLCALFVAVLLPLGSAHAAPPAWEIDRDHSSVYFDVRHTYATVRGQFDDFSGTFLFDPTGNVESSCEIEVNVKSINTNIRKRDDHLRSDDFFSSEKYPLMTFKSTRITHDEGDRYTIAGRLTVKDVGKDVAIPFTYYGVRENPLNEKQLVAGFEARFSIDRLEYHVGDGKYYKLGVVGKDVNIIITLEVLRDE